MVGIENDQFLGQTLFSNHLLLPKLSENSGPANSFCPENVVCFLYLLHIEVHFSKDFII